MGDKKLRCSGRATVTKECKPIKLYFALLNHGWVRREFAAHQLPEMNKTPGVELRWEEPSLTWGHPIYSNRNKIVKRFLASDCDFLMMQDDDILQLHNPAELVWADKDVIGCPAKVRTQQGTLDWVAYVHHPQLDGYVTVDMSRVPTDSDLISVDIVGTGLILIKRRVLEAIKAPFTVENDEDGVCEWGTDFAFCKRARAAGFEVYTTPHRVCEHFKETGLMEMDGYEESDHMDTSNYKYDIAWGGWAIQRQDWDFIKKAMADYGVTRVLEFGAGLSSLLMSERADVLTYETREDWAKDIQKKANGNCLSVAMWDGETPPMITQRGPFDMAFIDGPPAKGNGGAGREMADKVVAESGVPLVITHDSGRREELKLANRYLRRKYNIVAKNGNHSQRCQLWKKVDLAV